MIKYMKSEIPISARLGFLSVALVVVFETVCILTRLSDAFSFPPIRLIYAIGGVILLLGMWRRSQLAWKASLTVATLLWIAAAVCAFVLLPLSFRYPSSLRFYGLWYLFVAIYMYSTAYVLRRPACRAYFDSDGTGKRTG